jgi:hypothetical protein
MGIATFEKQSEDSYSVSESAAVREFAYALVEGIYHLHCPSLTRFMDAGVRA